MQLLEMQIMLIPKTLRDDAQSPVTRVHKELNPVYAVPIIRNNAFCNRLKVQIMR